MKESMNIRNELESVRRSLAMISQEGEPAVAFVEAVEARATDLGLQRDAEERLAELEVEPLTGSIDERIRRVAQREALHLVVAEWVIPQVPAEIAAPLIAERRESVLALVRETEIPEPSCELEHRAWIASGGRGEPPLRTLADKAAVSAWKHFDEQVATWRGSLQVEVPGDPISALVVLSGRRQAGLALVERGEKVRTLVQQADESHQGEPVAVPA